MKQISIKGVLEDLSNGFTRTKTSQGYDSTVGSIEEKYDLDKSDVVSMFKHPLLMNKKTKKAPTFTLIEDVDVTETIPAPVATRVPAYGSKPASADSPSSVPGVTANEEPQLTAEVQAQDSDVEVPLETAPVQQF